MYISTPLLEAFPPMSQRVNCPIIPSSCLSKGWRPVMLTWWVSALMCKKSGTPYIFEILRISQHSVNASLLFDSFHPKRGQIIFDSQVIRPPTCPLAIHAAEKSSLHHREWKYTELSILVLNPINLTNRSFQLWASSFFKRNEVVSSLVLSFFGVSEIYFHGSTISTALQLCINISVL